MGFELTFRNKVVVRSLDFFVRSPALYEQLVLLSTNCGIEVSAVNKEVRE